MKKKLIPLAAAGAASMALFSTTVADAQPAAPSVEGKTYGEAAGILSQAGFTARASTTTGDQLPQSKCVVTNQQASAFLQDKTVLLSLNCDATSASASKPGFSAGNPDGKRLQALQAAQAGGQ